MDEPVAADAARDQNAGEAVKLAVEDGHDADIPSKAASVDVSAAGRKELSLRSSLSASDHDRDPEKGESQTSKAAIAEGQPPASENKGAQVSETQADPNIVDWDGPDDPANPMNWTTKKKATLITILSILTLITPLASSMFAPAVPEVLKEFGSDSSTLAEFVVSVYILGFAIGPLVIAPLAELYGRWPLYMATNALFVVFTIACGLATNLNMLIAFRFFAGATGITPVTIGGGTIADIIKPERRGAAMSVWALGPLLGPVIGPVAGGYLSASLGWRYIFYILTAAAGAVAIALALFTRESYAPVLLARKAARLRKETGNENLRSKLDNGLSPGVLFMRTVVRPTKMLLLSPIVTLMSVYMAVVYGILYLLFTTFTYVFIGNYHFSESNVGLVYIGIGVGMLLGLVVMGVTSDRLVKHLKEKNGGVAKPEFRLPPLIIGSLPIPIGLFLYGWTAEKHVQWAVPLLGTLFVGVGLLVAFMCVQTYLIDAFTVYAASAIAANTVLRSFFGAFLPLAGLPMYSALGYGWGNSLLGFLTLAMLPIPLLFYKYGERIRTNPKFQLDL